mgnify:CR=1 FL=1
MNNSDINYNNFSKKKLENLLQQSCSGNTKSFEELSAFIRHISYTYFKSKHRLGKIINEEDVDDLTNNVYISFAEHYHNINNIEFWLRRVLFLTFVSWYKKEKKRKTYELDETYYKSTINYDPATNIDAEKIVAELNNLSEEKQQIVKLRFWGGLKFSEIAEQMDKTEVAVKKMFYRTIEELKKKV